MIKKIQSSTGAKLQFEQGRDDGPGDRKCILTGKPEQCEDAREKVMELIDSVQVRLFISSLATKKVFLWILILIFYLLEARRPQGT